MSGAARTDRLISVTLDDGSIGRGSPDIEHERAVAIYDLVEESTFAVRARTGPYRLALSLSERRLIFEIRDDMARRGLHDEGADIVRTRLKGKVDLDRDTARRLFTLIYVLHLRG